MQYDYSFFEKELSGKKILVTGGAGFIGSNLCEVLLELKATVYCLDNFSTGKRENINELLNNSNFHLIEGDIRDKQTCTEACSGKEFILHQAALGSVPRSINDPITSNNVNINGFLNMLWGAHQSRTKRFIYAASSSTYGDSKSLPKIEDEIGKPLSPYAITKLVNELYAETFYKIYGLNTIGLRYFNVFGKKQDPNGAYAAVIPKFIKSFLDLESPIINGDGSFSRDFTFIDNVVLMNLLALTTKNEQAVNQIYNTACGENTTLNELVDFIQKELCKFYPEVKNVKVQYGPERIGDVPHSLASIEKAKSNLGYSPISDVQSGLKNSIEWYCKNLKS